MKKIIILALFSLSATYCAEQPQWNQITPIFKEIKKEIDADLNPLNLPIFLQSPKAEEFRQKIEQAHFSMQDKNILMQQIAITIHTVSERWPSKRNFLALVIDAGADVNTYITLRDLPDPTRISSPSTFLEECLDCNDFPAVEFAIAHKAKTLLLTRNDFQLHLSQDVRISKLLIEHNGFKPFERDERQPYIIESRRQDLVTRCMAPNRPYQLLKFYKDLGLNLNFRCEAGRRSLLHCLISCVEKTSPQQFFEKLLILYKAGAVDLEERNDRKDTALDMIEKKDQNNPYVQFAQRLLKNLEKKPHIWKSQLLSVEQAKA